MIIFWLTNTESPNIGLKDKHKCIEINSEVYFFESETQRFSPPRREKQFWARRTPLVREPLARVGALAVELLHDGRELSPDEQEKVVQLN